MSVKKIIKFKLAKRKGWYLKKKCCSVKEAYEKYYKYQKSMKYYDVIIRKNGGIESEYPYEIYVKIRQNQKKI